MHHGFNIVFCVHVCVLDLRTSSSMSPGVISYKYLSVLLMVTLQSICHFHVCFVQASNAVIILYFLHCREQLVLYFGTEGIWYGTVRSILAH